MLFVNKLILDNISKLKSIGYIKELKQGMKISVKIDVVVSELSGYLFDFSYSTSFIKTLASELSGYTCKLSLIISSDFSYKQLFL